MTRSEQYFYKVGTTVEIFDKKANVWVGGYEVRRADSVFAVVIDKVLPFLEAPRITVSYDNLRLPIMPDPIWRDAEGNPYRITPTELRDSMGSRSVDMLKEAAAAVSAGKRVIIYVSNKRTIPAVQSLASHLGLDLGDAKILPIEHDKPGATKSIEPVSKFWSDL